MTFTQPCVGVSKTPACPVQFTVPIFDASIAALFPEPEDTHFNILCAVCGEENNVPLMQFLPFKAKEASVA